jgi:hypothetical protein
MADGFFAKITNVFKQNKLSDDDLGSLPKRFNVTVMEQRFDADDIVGAAYVLRTLLEKYGQNKKKDHRYKGREFIHFILYSKHKDLKNLGYKHWQNINKVIHSNHKQVYPYHKENVRKAIDFFQREIKALNSIDFTIDN